MELYFLALLIAFLCLFGGRLSRWVIAPRGYDAGGISAEDRARDVKEARRRLLSSMPSESGVESSGGGKLGGGGNVQPRTGTDLRNATRASEIAKHNLRPRRRRPRQPADQRMQPTLSAPTLSAPASSSSATGSATSSSGPQRKPRRNKSVRPLWAPPPAEVRAAARAAQAFTHTASPIGSNADIQQDRALREAQDREYARGLQADQALGRQERERMQQIMLESLLLERERAKSQQRAAARDQALERAQALVPDAPASHEQALTITFRFPERVVRRFPAATTTPAQVRGFVRIALRERSSKVVRFGLRSSYPRLSLGPEFDADDEASGDGDGGAASALDLSAEKEWSFFVTDLDA